MRTILWLIRSIIDAASAFLAGKKAGREERDEEIAEDNDRAREAARRARLDVDECYAQGGKWNQKTGKCE